MIPRGELVPSFVAHPDGHHWCGAIYVMGDLGPELLLYCRHRHRAMRHAVLCAQDDLRFAANVVELAERHRAIAP